MSALVLSVQAQEAARPTVDLSTKAAGQTPVAAAVTPTPTPAPAPELPDLPELSKLDEIFKQTSLGTKADESRMHIEWRRLRNRVTNDPDVIAARKAADTAHTDFEKRDRLRHYYSVYYARMEALTDRADIKAGLQDMKARHVGLADQNRVRPSPSPSPTSSPASSPAAQPSADESERPLPLPSTLPSETATPPPPPTDEPNQP
ncbi:MAG: hypothetical protein ABR514_00895 [Chthoniobacterales bacterium]